MSVRTSIIRNFFVLLAAVAVLMTSKYLAQARKPALLVHVSQLPTPITNGLVQFSVTASNASSRDMYIGLIQMQNNIAVDSSSPESPSSVTVVMGDDGVPPGASLTRVGWSPFSVSAKDRVFIIYAFEPGPIESHLRNWLYRVPFLRRVALAGTDGHYGVSDWFQAPVEKRNGTFDGHCSYATPLDPSKLAELNVRD